MDEEDQNTDHSKSIKLQFKSPAEAFKLSREGAYIIDVRKDYLRAYKQFDVKNVLFSELNRLYENIKKYPIDQKFIVAETSGKEKIEGIIAKLLEEGYTNLYILAGGFVEWERDGLPIKENINERLSGSCMCQLRPRQKGKSGDNN
jgi:rhodanese-related sulfurtransferase